MKNKWQIPLRVGVFSGIVVAILFFLNTLFQPVWFDWNTYYTVNGFYEEPENTIETVFLGSSVMTTGISPTELYSEYGVCSYSLAMEQQPMLASYYWLQEAYRLHSESLSTVVIDLSGLRSDSNSSFYHKAFDNMKLSEVKYNAVMDYVDGDYKQFINYVFPFINYHSRWTKLDATDIQKFTEDPVNGTRGYFYTDSFTEFAADTNKSVLKNYVLDETAKKATLLENSVDYLTRIKDFCNKKGLNLVYVKIPTRNWSSALHNACVEIAQQHNVEFLDYNFYPMVDKLDYLHVFDTSDYLHLNCYGATKFTRVLGKHLVENYNLADVRGVEGYSHMDEQLDKYTKRHIQSMDLKATENLIDYLKTATSVKNNIVVITVKETAANNLTESDKQALAEMGLVKLSEIEYRASYIGVIKNGKVNYEKLQLDDESTKKISRSITASNGDVIKASSGARNHGNETSITLNGVEYAANTRGLNIFVYNDDVNAVVDSTVFDTHITTNKDCYSLETGAILKAMSSEEVEKLDLNTYIGQAAQYEQRVIAGEKSNELTNSLAQNDLFGYIDNFKNDKDIMIFIAAKEEPAHSVSDANRAKLLKYGFAKLSDIGYKNSYIAIVDGGKVALEMIEKDNSVPVTYDSLGIYMKSAGKEAGNTTSIKVNGVEYSQNQRGLNVVTYNKKTNLVVDSRYFDTYKYEIYMG